MKLLKNGIGSASMHIAISMKIHTGIILSDLNPPTAFATCPDTEAPHNGEDVIIKTKANNN